MSTTTETKTTTKVRVLTDAHVRIVLWVPGDWGRYRTPESIEQYAKDLERAAREFHDFVRDHRSQDLQGIEVVREYEDQCSACRRAWEPVEDEGKWFCAYCGAQISMLERFAAGGEM